MSDQRGPMDHLNIIEQRANAATEGPWVREWSTPDQWWIIHGQPNPAKGDDRMVCPEVATLNHREDWTADAEFIAHARDDVPKLVAEVRRRMATEQRLRALHHPVPAPTSQHYHCEPYECDRAGEGELRDECGECGRWCPCPTIVALDGSQS